MCDDAVCPVCGARVPHIDADAIDQHLVDCDPRKRVPA